ncbi:MAG: 50S ribosomal protein L10 [Acidobacteria bacterium]|jgi:large subunit ribosomal protein L10|nr:50S ribosomal protein L10 [Acidobacteriota bacterium]
MLTKEQKHEQSVELRENLEGVNTLFLLENHGLKVNDVNRLRSEVRKTEATYKVVKNTVVRLAVEGTEMEGITPFLSGPKVLAYTGGDGVALAKVLKDFIKKHPELTFEQAYLEGQILEAKEAEKIADMPSRDELISKLVNLLQSPLRRLAVALNAPLQQFTNVITQVAEKGDQPAEETVEETVVAEEPPEAEEKPQEAQASDQIEEAPEAEASAQDRDTPAEEPEDASEAEEQNETQETQES